MFKHNVSTTRRNFFKFLGAGTAATALLGQNMLSAHAASTQSVTESNHEGAGINVLLVHGAYVDASSWNKVIPLLQQRGYTVLAVQIPMSSLQDDMTLARMSIDTYRKCSLR